jgi:U3 small nucleolar ribonucleoprotein protein IMP3
MVRKFQYHEKKLLKKVDFFQYKQDSVRENMVMRRYHLEDRMDYQKYNHLCGMVRKLTHLISLLDPKDEFRQDKTIELLLMLKRLGLVQGVKLSECEDIKVSSFCKRRLSTVMTVMKLAQQPSQAVKYIEQGHIRIGPNTVTDPGILIPVNMQDFITWTDSSKIKRKVLQYNEKYDSFDNPDL